MDIRPADLILVRGEDLIGNTIELITRSPYSHVAGVVGYKTLIEAQAFRKTGRQSLDFYSSQAEVFTCDELTDEQRALIVAEVWKHYGSRYSYLMLLWELLRYTFGIVIMPWKDWQPIICSTLWVNAYRAAGVDLCPDIRFPTPADLADSKLLRRVGSI